MIRAVIEKIEQEEYKTMVEEPHRRGVGFNEFP
jgi:hypothetical protein